MMVMMKTTVMSMLTLIMIVVMATVKMLVIIMMITGDNNDGGKDVVDVSNKHVGLLMMLMLVMARTNLNDVYSSSGDSNDGSGVDIRGGNNPNCGDGDSKVDYCDDLDGGGGDNIDDVDVDYDGDIDSNIGNDASCCDGRAKLIAVKIQLLKTFSTRSLLMPKLSASLTKFLLKPVAIVMIVQ